MGELISIIVPIYGVEQYLEKCIDSIVNQTYRNLEIILVDDGSPDNSGAICDRYAAEDDRIKVIHQENMGLSGARNTGMSCAAGAYFGFVDPDDYIEKTMVQSLYDTMKAADAQISVCSYRTVGDEQNEYCVPAQVLTREAALRALVTNSQIQSYVWNKLFRRELFEGLSFPVGKRYEDVRIMHRVFQRAETVALTGTVGYCYTIRSDSITGSTKWKNAREFFESLEQRCADLKDTAMYPYACYGEFVSIRRIVYEMLNEKQTETEFIRSSMDVVRRVYRDAVPAMSAVQRVEAKIFLVSPNAYRRCRNLAARLGR